MSSETETTITTFPTELNKRAMASVLGISEKQFGRYVEEAQMPYVGHGRGARYKVAECVQAYAKIQADIASKAKRAENVTEDDARVRKLVAEARIKEYECERLAGHLITVDDSDATLGRIITTLRYQLLGIPGAWTPQLLGQTDKQELSAILRRLTDDLMTTAIDAVMTEMADEPVGDTA